MSKPGLFKQINNVLYPKSKSILES